MAVLLSFVCAQCHEPTSGPYGAMDYPSVCRACEGKAAAEKKSMHLKSLEALTVEQRLSRIEEWIYDYEPQYVPPPRF